MSSVDKSVSWMKLLDPKSCELATMVLTPPPPNKKKRVQLKER